MSQKYNSEYINELKAFFIDRNDTINRYGNLISHFQALPGLIGLWYGGHYQRSTGNIPNLAPYISGASSQDLTYNGNPTFNYLTNGVGYVDLDGIGDYFSVADNADLDISGTESFVTNPGLTMGGWVSFDSYPAGTNYSPISKMGGAGNFSYTIYIPDSTTFARGLISVDGTAVTIVDSGSISLSDNHFIVIRFVPSTSLDIYLDGAKTSNIISIPASIYNSSAALELGRIFLAQTMPGKIYISFLCASALNDATIQSIFQQTRSLYGVL